MTANGQESPRRQEVLRALQQATDPVGVSEIADLVGIHPNTARFHLDALLEQGSVERTFGRPSGPGRPRLVYRTRPGMARGGDRRYRMLAEVLISQVTQTPDPVPAVTATGRTWGAHLVDRPNPGRRISGEEATSKLVGMLDELGFAPEAESADRIRLRHCPFLELAERHSDVICPLHLGLMQGALTELRAPMTASAVEPFAEADSCLAHLTPAAAS